MKKRFSPRNAAKILPACCAFIISIACIIFSGCGVNKATENIETVESVPTESQVSLEYGYASNACFMDKWPDTVCGFTSGADGKMYVLGYHNGEDLPCIIQYSSAGELESERTVQIEDGFSPLALGCGGDNELYFLIADETTYKIIDETGAISVDLSPIVKDAGINDRSFAVFSEGFAFCSGKDTVVIDKTGKETLRDPGGSWPLSSSGETLGFVISDDGDSSVCFYDNDSEYQIDGEFIPLALFDNPYEMYGYNSTGVYKVGADGTEEILTWEEKGLDFESVMGYGAVFDDGSINMLLNNKASKNMMLVQLNPSQVIPEENKEIITLGAIEVTSQLQKAITYFNLNSSDCKVEVYDYVSHADGDVAQAMMNFEKDILSGQLPDVVLLYGLSYEKYINKDVFIDLDQFIEDKQDYLPGPLEALTHGDKLIQLSPAVYISSLAGLSSEISSQSGWSFEEMINSWNTFSANNPGAAFTTGANGITTLNLMLFSCMSDFIDWDTYTADFDSQQFKEVLEFCASMEGIPQVVPTSKLGSDVPLLNNNSIFVSAASIWSAEDFYSNSILADGELTYVGFPTQAEGASAAVTATLPLAISRDAESPELAWSFIEALLSADYQASEAALPITVDGFEQLINDPPEAIVVEGELVEIPELTAEQKESLYALVVSANSPSMTESECKPIILEEARYYFKGEKTVDETAEIIQNRIQTYLNEQK